jgi:murein DD-endopeptidase MepM/ murein hydrolase activator NlpD
VPTGRWDGRRPGLVKPTAKLAVVLAAAGAAAIAVGSLLGLPNPLEQRSRALASALGFPFSAADSGIAAGVYKGPFQPVRGKHGYGKRDARFGALRTGHLHEGQDVIAKSGTPLVAIADGVVVDAAPAESRFAGGRGNYLAIYERSANRSYVYMHMLEPPTLKRGDEVTAGQLVGAVGCTGSCWGAHLHLELRRGKATLRSHTKPLDPLPLLKRLPPAPSELAGAG